MNEVVDWVVVGRFGRAHGVKGWLSVVSFTEPADNIAHYQPWSIKKQGVWQQLDVSSIQSSDKRILVYVEGCDTREKAALLTNSDIYVPKHILPELDEGQYYWHELVGMTVINKDQTPLGKVDEVMPTGANDVLVVQGENRYLIPFLLARFVLSVDKTKGQILVDWDGDF